MTLKEHDPLSELRWRCAEVLKIDSRAVLNPLPPQGTPTATIYHHAVRIAELVAQVVPEGVTITAPVLATEANAVVEAALVAVHTAAITTEAQERLDAEAAVTLTPLLRRRQHRREDHGVEIIMAVTLESALLPGEVFSRDVLIIGDLVRDDYAGIEGVDDVAAYDPLTGVVVPLTAEKEAEAVQQLDAEVDRLRAAAEEARATDRYDARHDDDDIPF